MQIKVLGPGCAKCNETEKLMRTAVQEAQSVATIEKVTDFKEMMKLGVMSTPAVVINGQVMCTGRVPSKAEVLEWLARFEMAPADFAISDCGCGCPKH